MEEICSIEQTHVHEVLGNAIIAQEDGSAHNHRFATVSCQKIASGLTEHVHKVQFRTDFYEGHYHTFCGVTGVAVPVGDRHVHFLESVTSTNDGHNHEFRVATLINNPIGD